MKLAEKLAEKKWLSREAGLEVGREAEKLPVMQTGREASGEEDRRE